MKLITFILLPNEEMENGERWIPSNEFNFKKYGSELLYSYFEIHDNDSKVVLESSSEPCPNHHLVMLQLMQQTVRDGQGDWEFPAFYKFEALDSETMRFTLNTDTHIFPMKPLFNALLKECRFLFEAMVPYQDYPAEGIANYNKAMDEFYHKINE